MIKTIISITIICIVVIITSVYAFTIKYSVFNLQYMSIISLSWDNSFNTSDSNVVVDYAKNGIQLTKKYIDSTVLDNWYLFFFMSFSLLAIIFVLTSLNLDGGFYNLPFDKWYKVISMILAGIFIVVSIITIYDTKVIQHQNKLYGKITMHQIKLFVDAKNESISHLSGNIVADRAIRVTELECSLSNMYDVVNFLNKRTKSLRYIQYFSWLAFTISIIMWWCRVFEKLNKKQFVTFSDFLEQERLKEKVNNH